MVAPQVARLATAAKICAAFGTFVYVAEVAIVGRIIGKLRPPGYTSLRRCV